MAKKKAGLSIDDMMGFDLRDKTTAPAAEKKKKPKAEKVVKPAVEDIEFVEEAPKKRGRPPQPKNTEVTPKGRDRDRPVTDLVASTPERDPLEEDDGDMGMVVRRKPARRKESEADGSKISRLNDDSLNSILGADAEMLQQLLENGDSDAASTVIQKRLLQTALDLIAQVENGVRESGGRYGVHSFNNLIMSIRELMTDMQATKDRGAMGITISESVLRPAMLDIAMLIMNEYASVIASAKAYMKLDDFKDFRKEVEESRGRVGAGVQQAYTESRDRIIEFMQR